LLSYYAVAQLPRYEVTILVPLTFETGDVPGRGGKAMREVARWFKQRVVQFGLLALLGAGCGGGGNDDTADATTTVPLVTTAGPTAFLAEARALPFGIKDLAAASDGDLLRLGRVVCDGLGIEGLGFSRVVQRLVRSEARPTTTEARAFVRTSVRNLCPEQASAIPS
jgi:hypothetical protein